MNDIPGPGLCKETILKYIRAEWIEGEDEGVSLEQEVEFYV